MPFAFNSVSKRFKGETPDSDSQHHEWALSSSCGDMKKHLFIAGGIVFDIVIVYFAFDGALCSGTFIFQG